MNAPVEITRRSNDPDFLSHMLDNAGLAATLTDEHSASSYGQPVVLRDGELLDYSAIESIHCPNGDGFEQAQKLAPFGIKVTRGRRDELPE